MTSLLEDWHTVSWRLVSRKQSYVLGWKGGRVQSEVKGGRSEEWEGGRERRWLGSLSLDFESSSHHASLYAWFP